MANNDRAVDQDLLRRMRDLRKRRGQYRSTDRASRELLRLSSMMPDGSLEREVFERAEIQGASYKAIAVALNISERHLYRIRRRMIEMIEAGESDLSARMPERLSALDLIATLLRYGHAQRAADAIRRAENVSFTARERIELAALQAMAACQTGDFPGARNVVERLAADSARLSEADRGYARRRLRMTQGYVSYWYGLYEEALAHCEAALGPHLRKSPGVVGVDELRSVATDAVFLGLLHQEGGSPQRAVDVLTFAEKLLRRSNGDVPLVELTLAYINRAFAKAALPDSLPEARRDADEALLLTRSNGLLCEEVLARLASGVLHEFAGDTEAALNDVRYALDLGRAVLSGDPLCRTHYITSRVQVFAGKIDETLTHIGEARSLVPPDSLLGTIAEIVEGRIHWARSDAAATFDAASRGIVAFQRRKTSTHYLGYAFLSRALAGERLGVDVRADAESAVHLLSRGGFIADQRRALELSARLTGNRRHEQIARELHA